jgi:hypothetical protein
MDFKPGHQIQADHEQIRHHDTSDDKHAAVGSECRCRMADRGLACQADSPSGSQECVGAAERVPLGSGAYGAASRGGAAEIRFMFVCLQCRASRPKAR